MDMSGFIVTAPTASESEEPIVSGPFWPNIDPTEIRKAQRIDDTTPAPRLRMVIIEAIATTNGALRDWRDRQIASGNNRLVDIAAEEIDGTSILAHRYQRAVGCLSKALLLERYKDFDATCKGDKKADALTDPIGDCRRDHLNALADITGRPRCTIELI